MALTLTPRLARTMLTALAAGACLCAGSASAVTFTQAYEAALTNDATYLSAIQERNAGLQYKALGRANLLPQLSASYSANRNRADQIEPNIFGVQTPSHPVYVSHSSTVQLRQPLFSLDAYARYKQGVAQATYSEQQFDGRVQEMILRVAGAYIDALFADAQLELTQVQRDTYKEQKQVNDHLFARGEGTRTDMLETESRLDLSEAQVLEAVDNQQNARATLATLIGAEVTTLDQLRPQFRIAPLPEGGFEALKKSALDNNPEVQAQISAIEAARQEVNKSRAGYTPRVDFVAVYSKGNADSLNTYEQQFTNRTIGVQVNIPLYTGGQVTAQYRQAVAGQEKAKADLQAKIDKVTLDLRKNYMAVVSSASRIRALEKAVESGQLLVTATEQSIKGGVRINLDLLNAKQQLYTSQRDLAQARYTYLVNLLRVKGAAGSLSSQDVREIAGYFM